MIPRSTPTNILVCWIYEQVIKKKNYAEEETIKVQRNGNVIIQNSIFQSSQTLVDSPFLVLHLTRFPFTKVKYPEIDLLSFFELAQSASVYPSTFKFS